MALPFQQTALPEPLPNGPALPPEAAPVAAPSAPARPALSAPPRPAPFVLRGDISPADLQKLRTEAAHLRATNASAAKEIASLRQHVAELTKPADPPPAHHKRAKK